MSQESKRRRNEEFVERLRARRPDQRAKIDASLRAPAPPVFGALEGAVEALGGSNFNRDLALETIVRRERPVLFIQNGKFNLTEVTEFGEEAKDLVSQLSDAGPHILPLLPLIGRIDVENFPGADFLGTGWFVDTDVVVTNRHVASLIAHQDASRFVFSRGIAGRTIGSSFCNGHEFDDLAPDASRIFRITEVLYIEPESGANDVAFLRVRRRTNGIALPFVPIAEKDARVDDPVCVIGYPARASRKVIPDQRLMEDLYRGRFDVKRVAPGLAMELERGAATHDCTTLGGNSGSVVLDLAKGHAVGLHFAGLYEDANFAVRASVLSDYVRRRRWTTPPAVESRQDAPAIKQPATAPVPAAAVPALGTGSVSFVLPLTINVSLGSAALVNGSPGQVVAATATTCAARLRATDADAERAVLEYWDAHPDGVLAARVGYLDDGDRIGEIPCIAVSVSPASRQRFELSAAKEFRGVPIRYLSATVDEQIESMPLTESVDSIAYDDEARTSQEFSFQQVNEPMKLLMHVGPEYSWDVLKDFLSGGKEELVSAMYEFHAAHIRDTIDERLKDGVKMKLVLDNATFAGGDDEGFDRVETFDGWANESKFERIVAPEGRQGLISDSYHIKVTVRDGRTLWLSSGNWKPGSSQPIVTQEQRDNAAEDDLPGNREWHVVVENETLAHRFKSHILQDFVRSEDLGGSELPRRLLEETMVDVPLFDEMALERRAPSRLLEPKELNRKVKVTPLLTPDHEGAVYSEAVLNLIRSATKSLFFQIPYIGMPNNPRTSRGFIDDLIAALAEKLRDLDDARLILRGGGAAGKAFSSPTHAAWFFKSKGVDIASRMRVIENHHTKGMIVDGRKLLLGSHNWSKPGVTLNRDASLLFDDAEVAGYYTQAFEIDWQRANPIKPRRFVKESALEAAGSVPLAGYVRMPLSEALRDD